MESAPLTLAHDHARAASVATQGSDTTVAINQHALAAGEFAKAASGTGSAEAMRTLRLLEQHHQRLSELLGHPAENTSTKGSEAEVQAASEKPLSTSAAVAELRASKSDLGLRSSSPHRNPPGLGPRRHPPRDLTSSIASNLASARGIRGKYTRGPPLSPSVSTHQAPGSLETHRRHQLPSSIPEYGAPSWLPPTSPHKAESKLKSSRTSAASEAAPAAGANDEGFSRFYSAFENILYKLSAPLAFAGLPLANEDKTPEQETTHSRRTISRQQSQTSEPDLTKYISKAALRASSRDGQSANDSFYVVPTAGGTISYARIISFAEKEKRRLAASMHSENSDLFPNPDEEDNFVDARETLPASPRLSRDSTRKQSNTGEKELLNKVEELGMENKSLKDCIDKLAKRLQAFEMSAQQSSMALHESMRLVRDMSPVREREQRSPVRSPISRKGRENSDEAKSSDDSLQKKVQELEEHVHLSTREIEKLGKENEKLKTVVARYRERWEKLKEGAKTRREGSASSTSTPKKDPDPAAGRFIAG